MSDDSDQPELDILFSSNTIYKHPTSFSPESISLRSSLRFILPRRSGVSDIKNNLAKNKITVSMKSASETSKLDRKTVERNRRIQMKGLCFKLASMVPTHYFKSSKSKEIMTQQSQLDLAASYIKSLTKRIENLNERKEKELGSQSGSINNKSIIKDDRKTVVVGSSRLPVIKMSESGNNIEVMLISGVNKNFMFYEVISVLEEEGAEVVSANFSTVGDKIFHTLHAQVKISRVGVETTRVWQRLQELIY